MYSQVGAFLTAIAWLMLKTMFSEDGIDTLVAWNLDSTVPVTAIPAAIFRTRSKPDASRLAPASYFRLPLVALLAYWFFEEVAGPAAWIGAAIIAGSTAGVVGGDRLNRHGRIGRVS
ncbi:MAG: hypothetical protein OXN84_19765 [Albidovulum sp.]|nr:hypothetical protein [Albidovulum sp.]